MTIDDVTMKAKKVSRLSSSSCILLTISIMIIFGILFCAHLIPSSDGNLKNLKSVYSSKSIKAKNADIPEPDWNIRFWTPISIDLSSEDPIVTLCQLDFQKYSQNPHIYPMFKILVAKSKCYGKNVQKKTLSELNSIKNFPSNASNLVTTNVDRDPSGFVFHESRVGSTLVTNILASDPYSLVFSESDPPATVLLHCNDCTAVRRRELFRDIVRLMGRSPIHSRYFFKFQSITSTKMAVALEAFPAVPWVYLYRHPVQTMMSHLDPLKNSRGVGAPCLRTRHSNPIEVKSFLNNHIDSTTTTPNEAWCAAHLTMLCNHAITAYQQYSTSLPLPATASKTTSTSSSTSPATKQRGVLLNYESLPGSVPLLVLPLLFRVPVDAKWLEKMVVVSKMYSKGGKEKQLGGSTTRVFTGDSKDKETRATKNIQKWATDILFPVYKEMQKLSLEGILKINNEMKNYYPSITGTTSTTTTSPLSVTETVPVVDYNWSIWSSFPSYDAVASNNELGGGGLSSTAIIPYSPWNPFSNTHTSQPYERVSCPPTPSADYPKAYPVMSLLDNWSADNTEVPEMHYDSICHFDYATEFDKAVAYRDAEKPFIVYNVPEVDKVVKKWSSIEYLKEKIGKRSYHTETSRDNHFMYWRRVQRPEKFKDRYGKPWKPPTQSEEWTFSRFLETAIRGQNMTLEARKHAYFRVTALGKDNPWLFDELPFFKPKPSLFIVDPAEQNGIHCRFGMRSVIAEAHYDGSRNFVAMMSGLRRWIMTHPNQCSDMYLLPRAHPSGRHSDVDWSKPDLQKFPNFAKVLANEVILKPGDVLYVPTDWFHYIVSLNLNVQCNTRSGATRDYEADLKKCGF